MAKIDIIIFHIIVVCLLASCSNSGKQEGNLVDINSIKGKEIKGAPAFEELILGSALTHFSFIDESALFSFMNDSSGEPLLLYNEKDKTERWIGNWGSGPGEMFSQEYAGKSADNDTIYAYDITFRNVLNFVRRKDTPSGYVYHETIPIPDLNGDYLLRLKRMDNGFFVGYLWSGKRDMLILFDREMNVICRFGGLPIKGLPEEQMSFNTFDGVLSTCGNSVYFACTSFGYLTRIDISESGEATQIWEKYFSEPQYEYDEGVVRIKGHDNLDGFYGLAVNKDYLFATYSGIYALAFSEMGSNANLPQTLVVMDVRDGKILQKCHLDQRASILALSADNQKLYAEVDEPEIGIMSYDMKDILPDY